MISENAVYLLRHHPVIASQTSLNMRNRNMQFHSCQGTSEDCVSVTFNQDYVWFLFYENIFDPYEHLASLLGMGPRTDIKVVSSIAQPQLLKEDLVHIVKTSSDRTHKVLALRAYIRMIGMEPYRSPEDAVGALKEALVWAERPEEQKLILGILPQFSCPDALKLAESLLREKGVEEEAKQAVQQIRKKLNK